MKTNKGSCKLVRWALAILLNGLILAEICMATSPTHKPEITQQVDSGASGSQTSDTLPAFTQNVPQMNVKDRDNLHQMIGNVLKFYENTLKPLEAQSRFGWSSIKNSIQLGANFCQAAFTMTKGIKIAPKFPIEDDYFEMVAVLGRTISSRANDIARTKSYKKDNVNKLELKQRAQSIMDKIHELIGNSPYGLYLQWDKLASLQDSDKPGQQINMIEEMADTLAQLRAVDIVHDMNTIQGVFNQLRKDNRRLLRKLKPAGSTGSTSGAASDDSDRDEQNPGKICSSTID